MKFLLLSFALILPVSAAPAWFKQANIPPKAPLRKISPTKLSYTMSWNGRLKAGNFDILFGKKDPKYPKHFLVHAYGGSTGCSQANATLIAHAMWDVGANDSQVYRMLGIVSRESGCDSSAYNPNRRSGDDSWGFCQLNSLAGFFRSGGILESYNRWSFADDPRHNARACAALYARCGFGPWIKGDYGCRRP